MCALCRPRCRLGLRCRLGRTRRLVRWLGLGARAQSGMVSASRRLKLPSKAARLRSIIVAAAHPEAAEQRGVLEHFPDGAYRRGIVFEGSSSDADDEFDLLRCGSGLPTARATPQARARASAAACGSTRLIARLALRLALRRHEVNRVVRDARRWSVGRGVQSERRAHTHDSTFSRVDRLSSVRMALVWPHLHGFP